jgi:hypothetical protein
MELRKSGFRKLPTAIDLALWTVEIDDRDHTT